MKRSLLLFVLPIAMLIAAVSSCNIFRKYDDCSSDADCGRGNACHPTDHYCLLTEPVKVGAVFSLSGNLKLMEQGTTCKNALDFIHDYINQQDIRPLDRGFDIVYADDQSDTTQAGLRAADLTKSGVLMLLGSLTSAQTLEVQNVTGPARLLQVTPFAGATAIETAQGPLHQRFLLSLSPAIRAGSPLALVKYLDEQNQTPATAPHCKSTFVIHNDDVTGSDFYCTFASTFRVNDMCVIGHIPVSTNLKDSYTNEVTTVINTKPDCVILGANPDVAGAILEEVERRFIPPAKAPWTWLGNTQTHTPEFLTTTLVANEGRSRAEGFRGADVDYTPQRLAYSQMLDLYNTFLAGQGKPALTDLPARFSVCADLGMLVALTIEKAGQRATPEQVRDAYIDIATFSPNDTTVTPAQFLDGLRMIRRGVPIDYKGAASDCELDDTGMSPSCTFNIWQVKNGAFDERVRQYDDGETSDVALRTVVTPNCAPVPDCQ
jgi:ABC-type branched-subunit amino acid transport system substrate-binding protein